MLAGLDAVTADDVGRVAETLLAPEKLRLAAIGPFEDESRFEALLDLILYLLVWDSMRSRR